jgi:hypothetical protein
MRTCGAAMLAGAILFVPGATWAVDAGAPPAVQLPVGMAPAVEPFVGLGEIDWTRGEAVALGQARVKAPVNARSKKVAIRLARVRAYRNALALVAQVRVDADQTLKALAGKRREIDLSGFIQGHKLAESQTVVVGEKTFQQVRLRVPFYGIKGLSAYIYDYSALKPLPLPLRQKPWRRPAHELAPDLLPPIIVIDTTGLGVEAAVYPKVQDNLGRALLSIADRDPAVAISEGMVTYVTPAPSAPGPMGGQTGLRTPDNLAGLPQLASSSMLPAELVRFHFMAKRVRKRRRRITVKAKSTAPGGKVNVVLSAADSKKLANDPEAAKALKSGQVYIVVDARKAAIEGRLPTPGARDRLAGVDPRTRTGGPPNR